MHRPKTERQALAQRLLGTASEPGPIDVGWLKRRLGVKGGSYIKRWREGGIPETRLDDIQHAIAELLGHDEAAAPVWAAAMESRLVDELGKNRQLIEALARPEIWRTAERVIARLEALGPPADEAPGGTDGGEGQGVAGPLVRGRG